MAGTRIKSSQKTDGPEHILLRLTRKTEDHMHDHLDPCTLQFPYSLLKHLKPIAAVDPLCGPVMHGLQPKLDPHRFDGIQPPQHPHDILIQTVRPCCDGEDHDLVPQDDPRVQIFQVSSVPVGIGKGLKISDKPAGICLVPDALLCFLDLPFEVRRLGGKLSGSAL